MSIKLLEDFYTLKSRLTEMLCGSTEATPSFRAFLDRHWRGVTPNLSSLLLFVL